MEGRFRSGARVANGQHDDEGNVICCESKVNHGYDHVAEEVVERC